VYYRSTKGYSERKESTADDDTKTTSLQRLRMHAPPDWLTGVESSSAALSDRLAEVDVKAVCANR